MEMGLRRGGLSGLVCDMLFEASGITKSFGGVAAVRDVGLEVEEGAVVAVIGPNGAGKTTLINLVTGVLPPDSGTVRFSGADVTRRPLEGLARLGLTRTFQHPRVFRNMTVIDNVMVAARSAGTSGMFVAGFRLPQSRRTEQRARAVAVEALDMVRLACDPDTPSELLTPGQDKLLELARVVATKPRLVFLDEPAAGLDDHETAELADRVGQLRREGLTVVLVEHNMQMVMELADSIVVMDSGVKIAEGTPEMVRADPAVIAAYLGGGGESEGAKSVLGNV